jgi:hypothetical protein
VAPDPAALRSYLEGRGPSGPPPLVLDWEGYLDLFRAAGDTPAIGEGTVGYFWLPGAAQAIHAAVPDARLIFVLRDPAERLFSHHLAALWHDPDTSFRERFLAAAAAPGLIEEGRFATNLERFFGLFPRNRIRIHLYEDYRADPRAVLRDIFTFLGVNPDHSVDLSQRHNETIAPRSAALHGMRRRLFGNASTRWMPEPVRRMLGWLYRRAGASVAMNPDDRRLVIDFYQDEIRRTADLIGRDLSAWLR